MPAGKNTPRSILVVDDDEIFRERLVRAFEDRGLRVHAAGNGGAALEISRTEAPDLALVDLRMPGMPGLDLVVELAALEPPPRIVVLTGYGSIATALEAVRRGAAHYLTKPADADEILAAFDRDPDTPAALGEDPETVPSLARTEWEHIHRVLADCDGNISKAARLLGIHRRSLQRKLAKYPVSH
ncbi:MAG: response regulator [bacterium]|nr:response regulator [bacterium]